MRFKMPEGDLVHGDGTRRAAIVPDPSPFWDVMFHLDHGVYPPDSGLHVAAVNRQMKDLGVRVVVVGPMDHRDLAVACYTAVMSSPPDNVGGVSLWRAS